MYRRCWLRGQTPYRSTRCRCRSAHAGRSKASPRRGRAKPAPYPSAESVIGGIAGRMCGAEASRPSPRRCRRDEPKPPGCRSNTIFGAAAQQSPRWQGRERASVHARSRRCRRQRRAGNIRCETAISGARNPRHPPTMSTIESSPRPLHAKCTFWSRHLPWIAASASPNLRKTRVASSFTASEKSAASIIFRIGDRWRCAWPPAGLSIFTCALVAADSAAFHGLERHFHVCESKLRGHRAQLRLRRAGGGERTEQHVAADAGSTVQVRDAHHSNVL